MVIEAHDLVWNLIKFLSDGVVMFTASGKQSLPLLAYEKFSFEIYVLEE